MQQAFGKDGPNILFVKVYDSSLERTLYRAVTIVKCVRGQATVAFSLRRRQQFPHSYILIKSTDQAKLGISSGDNI
jgi:hypothetical protein